MIKGKLRWIPPVLWGAVIIILSLLPGGVGNLQFLGIPHIDKIGHFGMYGIWAFLIFNALSGNKNITLQKVFWLTFVVGTTVGIILEYGQYTLTSGRSFEIGDMIANGLGSFMGALAGILFQKFRNQWKDYKI